MRSSYLTPFSKALLTGLFVGIAATFVCIIYNIIWRNETDFPLFNFINVSSLIFAVNILFVVIGVVYYWFTRYIKRGEIFFIVLFTIITLLCILKVADIHRSGDAVWNLQFHHLMIAMLVIMGISAVFGIPFLYHNKGFEDTVL
jgi:hypothetical protein